MLIRTLLSGGDTRTIVIGLIAFVCAALLSIMIHEVAHGYIALKNGDPTAKFSGRLNLNPKNHFDLFGLAMFLFVGVGWAKPVPIDSRNFNNYKKGMVQVSLAGVTSNLILAFLSFGLFGLCVVIINKVGTDVAPFFDNLLYLLYMFFQYMVILNISLIAFNLLPVYPLDGYRLIETFVPNSGFCRFMRQYGSYVLLGLIVLGSIIPQIDILGMYISWVRNLLLTLLSLVWGVIF